MSKKNNDNNKKYQNTNIRYLNSDSKKTYLEKNQEDKDNYKRPDITYTDKLSNIQIKQLLYDYEQVKNVNELMGIPPGTHLRYFEMKDKELKFRTGGIITVNSGLPDYIILSNGRVSWSVQAKTCIFFRRITIKEIREEYERLLREKHAEIAGNNINIQNLSKKNKELIDIIKNLKKMLNKK